MRGESVMDSKDKTGRIAGLRAKAREVREQIIEMIYRAQSGHPGGSLSAADIMTALYFDLLRHDPANPGWPERDRLILSKGHACPVWYACLALRGFFPPEELATLRRYKSILQGHPTAAKTPGLDATTGSLGMGMSMAVGAALEGRLTGSGYTVYVILGDGELNEGVVWEAAAAAHKYTLDNLVAVVDYNGLQLDGFTAEVMPMEPVEEKFAAFNWRVMRMDGHDMAQVIETLEQARDYRGKPVCIIADTVKGKGVSYMENECGWHGKAPNREQYRQALEEIRRAE
jgi:transketolase